MVKDEHHIDFEDICIRQVTITGTFNQWKERVPLKMKSIRNILHYVKTVDVPMNEEFKFDVSCEIRDDRIEITPQPQDEGSHDGFKKVAENCLLTHLRDVKQIINHNPVRTQQIRVKSD